MSGTCTGGRAIHPAFSAPSKIQRQQQQNDVMCRVLSNWTSVHASSDPVSRGRDVSQKASEPEVIHISPIWSGINIDET